MAHLGTGDKRARRTSARRRAWYLGVMFSRGLAIAVNFAVKGGLLLLWRSLVALLEGVEMVCFFGWPLNLHRAKCLFLLHIANSHAFSFRPA
jgi:hypothetical protein